MCWVPHELRRRAVGATAAWNTKSGCYIFVNISYYNKFPRIMCCFLEVDIIYSKRMSELATFTRMSLSDTMKPAMLTLGGFCVYSV